jgi:hypothetical protein
LEKDVELTESVKKYLIETAERLKGSERRFFMARTVKELGIGGQRRAEKELGWDRTTIRKGMNELNIGITCLDAFRQRGRRAIEEHMPNLLLDITNIVDGQSQTDPSFKTNRLYTRLSAREVKEQLILQKGYEESQLPSEKTIANKLNALGYYPSKVLKSKPKKRSHKQTQFFHV